MRRRGLHTAIRDARAISKLSIQPRTTTNQYINTENQSEQEPDQTSFNASSQAMGSPYAKPDGINTSGDTLILTEDDLCTNSSSEKECHVYIERINLSTKSTH